LVGERHGRSGVDCELTLADHVDQLDAGKHRAGWPRNDLKLSIGLVTRLMAR